MRIAFVPLLLIFPPAALPAAAQDVIMIQIVLRAQPSTLVKSTSDLTQRDVLSAAASADAEIRILESRGRYRWQTRGDCLLEPRRDGRWTTFVGIDCEGYVRVLDQRDLSPSDARWIPGAAVQYMEHRVEGLATRTFYGSADRFDP